MTKFVLSQIDDLNAWIDAFVILGHMPLQLSYIKGNRVCGSMVRNNKEVFFAGNVAGLAADIGKGSIIKIKLSKLDILESKGYLEVEFVGSFTADLSPKTTVVSKKVLSSRTF